MNYRIEDTSKPNRTVCMHDAARPWAIVADRSWNAVIGRYATEAAAKRRVRDLAKQA